MIINYQRENNKAMKTYKQTCDIIEYVRSFHNLMRNLYERLHEKDEKQKVKMLLDYLCRHEKHREDTLAKYEKEESRRVMDTWFKYVPENIPLNCFENFEIKSHMSVDDIVHIALQLNNYLIELYKGLVRETEVIEVRDVFNYLLVRIKNDEKNLARDVLWLKDL